MRRLLICLAALGGVTVLPGKSLAASARHDARSSVLFRWALPASGHLGAWTAHLGVLRYNGASDRSIFPRYTLPRGIDFAIQAQLRTTGIGAPGATLTGFGLTVRTAASDPHSAVSGGSFFSSGDDNGPELFWDGQTAGGTAFDPKSAWHLYRLEVRGNQYTLRIDGKEIVTYTIDGHQNPARAGVFSRYYRVAVRNFEVLRLGAATTTVQAAPELRAANLTIGDLPATGFYLPTLSHWYTNVESARERGVPLSALVALGRIDDYGVEFYARSRDVNDIYSSISAYQASTGAQQDMTGRLAAIQQQIAQIPNVSHQRQLTELGIGDVSGGYQFEFSVQGLTSDTVVIDFTRGRYLGFLRLEFDSSLAPDPDTNLAFTVNLAHILDARLQALH